MAHQREFLQEELGPRLLHRKHQRRVDRHCHRRQAKPSC